MFPTTTRASLTTKRPQQDPTVVVYRISGAFFFGAAASIGAVLERIGDAQRNLIIDFSAVPFVDSTGAKTIEGLAHKAAQRGVGVYAHGDVGGGQEGTGRARRPPTAGQEGGLDRSGLGRNSGTRGQHRRRWLSLSIRPRLRPKCRHPRLRPK